jgi:hypothetical protein
MTTVHDPDVTAYLRDVRAALDDLPPDDREELLEGLEADLTELRAEQSGSLTERLGSPEAYAAELRSAAGLPPHRAVPATTTGDRLREAARPAIERMRAVPGAGRAARLLDELRPAWWVARGYLVAWIISRSMTRRNPGVLPRLEDSLELGLLLLLGAVLVSVWIGRRRSAHPGIRAAVVALNVAVLFLAFVNGIQYPDTDGNEVSYPCCGLISPAGNVITDIRPYDSEGRPLSDVQLYDQYGLPVEVSTDRLPRVREDGTVGQNVFPISPAPDELNGEVRPGPVAPLLPRPSVSPSP